MKKGYILLVLLLFLAPATAAADSQKKGIDPALYLAEFRLDSNSLIFADHNESASEGNWIMLYGGDPVLLPRPLNFTYQGVNRISYRHAGLSNVVQVYTSVDRHGYKKISYPYETHPVYTNTTGKNHVSMDFNGAPAFANQKASVYVIKASPAKVYDTLEELRAGNVEDYQKFFQKNFKKEYESYKGRLDKKGDLKLDLGTKAPGHYTVLILLDKPQKHKMIILSATAFEVVPYELKIKSLAASGLGTGSLNADIEINGPNTNYTYVGVLINNNEYRAELGLESDGTKKGTNLSLNEKVLREGLEFPDFSSYTDLIKYLGINTSNPDFASLTGPGSQYSKVSATTNHITMNFICDEDTRPGNYTLFVGALESGKSVAGFAQKQIFIGGSESSSKGGTGNSGKIYGPEELSGVAASGEPASNILLTETMQVYIYNGTQVIDQFSNPDNPVRALELETKKDFGLVTTRIEILCGNHTVISSMPEGKVYRCLNIMVGDENTVTPKTIKNAAIKFRVEKTWLSKNNIDESMVTLCRYSGSWDALPTQKTGEDAEFVYFEARTPGFSPFTITASPEGQGSGNSSKPIFRKELASENDFIMPLLCFLIGLNTVILISMALKKKR